MEARRIAEVFKGTHSSVFLLCRGALTLSELEILTIVQVGRFKWQNFALC